MFDGWYVRFIVYFPQALLFRLEPDGAQLAPHADDSTRRVYRRTLPRSSRRRVPAQSLLSDAVVAPDIALHTSSDPARRDPDGS